jgi:hypothetical protein
VDGEGALGTDIYLAAASGKIAPLNAAPLTGVGAASHATPQVWCEALLRGERSAIATTGDETLFNTVFGALSSALLA